MTIHYLPDAEARYHAMSQAFELAVGNDSEAQSGLRLALSGLTAELRVAGRSLRHRVERPLRHLTLPPEPTPPNLRIDLWDQTETGVDCAGCFVDPTIDTWGDWRCSPDGRFLVHHRRTALEIYDRKEGRIVGWSTGPIHVSHHERGRPLLRLLMQWHRDQHRLVVHGGLVETNGCGVLLVGKGGSGKSTTALLAALDGMTFLAEDFLSLGRNPDGSFEGYSLYASAKLHPGHIERFPRLATVALGPEHPEDDKSLLLLEDLPSCRLGRQVRIGAVVAPRVVDRPETRSRPLSRSAALMDLAPSTLVLLNAHGLGLRRGEVLARNLQEFASLLEVCPAYRLELGHDLDGVVPALRHLIVEAQEAVAASPSTASDVARGPEDV